MVVDYERAWLRLKSVINAKNSHGKRELFEAMTQIELECETPEHGIGSEFDHSRLRSVRELDEPSDRSLVGEPVMDRVAPSR